ncbi:MAG TPA: hypothetical protein PKA00_04100 [Saprospiraceae bacterium]|nr:hypothetical protein [Saprospiraceae bacterium]HMQ82061.1 hypothetical protein [Saprospiraceae bacterium]
MLTEQDIKVITLGFLKHHYRNRQRESRPMLTSDVRGAGGVIADGFLSYESQEGQVFRATFEATSYDTKSEVKYKLMLGLLLWDAAAVAAVITTMIFFTVYILGRLPIKQTGLFVPAAFTIILFGILFMIYRFSFQRLRRYRYIYAIEQFKRYHADEQWVAIGEDVFLNSYNDPDYMELRNQCIYNGFGLIVVQENKKPIMQITPSREDIFKNKRARIAFLSQNELLQKFKDGYVPEWLKQFNLQDQSRFKRRYAKQMAVVTACVLVVSGIFFKELQEKLRIYEEPEAYLDKMELVKQKNKQKPESLIYELDTPFTWPMPFLKDEKPYMGLNFVQTPRSEKSDETTNEGSEFITILPGENEFIEYDCTRLKDIEKTVYILQVDVAASYAEATARIAELRYLGWSVSGLWLGCFNDIENGFTVYVGNLNNSFEEANQALLELEEQLGDNVLAIKPSIRSLIPRSRE